VRHRRGKPELRERARELARAIEEDGGGHATAPSVYLSICDGARVKSDRSVRAHGGRHAAFFLASPAT